MNADAMLSRRYGYKVYDVVRQVEPGQYVEGKFQVVTQVVPVGGLIVPLSGQDLMHFEEGDRTVDRRKMYTSQALKTKDQVKQTTADRVFIDDRYFEVERVEPWSGLFWVIILTSVNPEERR